MEGYDYAKYVEISKCLGWDIDKDVPRRRKFDISQKFLPDGLSKGGQLEFLNENDRRLLSRVQGRTYANIFGFAERFIVAKILEDEPKELLGKDTSANPQERPMGAVNACILNTYVVAAAMKGIRLEKVEMETEGELDQFTCNLRALFW
jgi:hypothetical protein